MRHDLIFELGVEELPSGLVYPLAESLAHHLCSGLDKAGILYGESQFFATPRRLAVFIKAVQERQASQQISRRGPAFDAGHDANGQPSNALLGFAKSCGVPVSSLQPVETDKGRWWFYESQTTGALTSELLPALINTAIASLSIPKPMRWGSGSTEFARPVHWVVLLFGEQLIGCDVLGVKTGRHSMGHRFLHPQAIAISSPAVYEETLRSAFVIANFSTRRQLILEQIQAIADEHHFSAVTPSFLVDEVTSIVEWPVALLAQFEPKFLTVPAEALIASMQSHQKCFALCDSQNNLVPYFITVSNIKSQNPAQICAGNEKVMRARLSDAAFFYQTDQRQPLSEYRDATKQVLFQAKLGTLLDKSERLIELMGEWTDALHLDPLMIIKAGSLSKCDLMTGMVGEFPELQGQMGYYYALNDGEDLVVAEALKEQYWPRFSGDELPSSSLGAALSLADRLDTLVGGFAIGQKPTGVKDPYKLRRHALAVIRLLIQLKNAPTLPKLIQQAACAYGDALKPDPTAMESLRLFILDRLFAFYETQGVRADQVHAVRAREEDSLFDVNERLMALRVFSESSAAVSLSAACKRVSNLLQNAAFQPNNTAVLSTLFQEPAEHELYQHVIDTEERVRSLYRTREYREILIELARLRAPVDAFFEHVRVMVDDLPQKNNRLALLVRLQTLLQGVADIALLDL